MTVFIIIGLVSYLLGSIPAGYIVGRFAGVDIRRVGSGNIGATNVLRALGKPLGYTVFAIDFLKGVGAVLWSIFVTSRAHSSVQVTEFVNIAAGVLCVLGHVFPVWLGFKGGKGVATSAGVLFGLMPLASAIVLTVWLIVFQITKYVSIASIAAAFALPVVVFTLLRLTNTSAPGLTYFSICLAIIIVWRHRSNLTRLKQGTEQSFKRK